MYIVDERMFKRIVFFFQYRILRGLLESIRGLLVWLLDRLLDSWLLPIIGYSPNLILDFGLCHIPSIRWGCSLSDGQKLSESPNCTCANLDVVPKILFSQCKGTSVWRHGLYICTQVVSYSPRQLGINSLHIGQPRLQYTLPTCKLQLILMTLKLVSR